MGLEGREPCGPSGSARWMHGRTGRRLIKKGDPLISGHGSVVREEEGGKKQSRLASPERGVASSHHQSAVIGKPAGGAGCPWQQRCLETV